MDQIIEFIKNPIFLKILIIVLSVVVFLILFWLFSKFVASYIVYIKTLKRESKNKWSRDLPSSLDKPSLDMYDMGEQWHQENLKYKKDVHIIRDGLNLYGEYYDYGKETCAVILSGRTESLRYGYYFAQSYYNFCNILVIDPRAHGLSDGTYNTVGFEESKDIVEWVKYMNKEWNVNSFVFHGICIGSAGGLLALVNEDCPKLIKGFVAEGMFPNFGESLKNHLIERKKSLFITYNLITKWMMKYTGHDMNIGPINFIEKLDVPLLMLHSKEDMYSKPEYAQKLFDLAGSENKSLVWFEKGKHSFLRYTDTNKYNKSIEDFLNNILQFLE